ncbi:hypothetical protein ACYAFX_07365 [Rhodococcus aetherivorans]
MAFAPDGRTLASASWDGTAKLWSIDPATRAVDEMRPALAGNGGGVPALAFTPTVPRWSPAVTTAPSGSGRCRADASRSRIPP